MEADHEDDLGEETPLSPEAVRERVRQSWQAWLVSLATDAEAATAAAHLYAELPDEGRDAWLDALDEDSPSLSVPQAAVYGPLLAVETDETRHARIALAAGMDLGPINNVARALLGTGDHGVRIAVLVIPLYLDFFRLLVCRFTKDKGFDWVKQQPMVRAPDLPSKGDAIEGVQLFRSSTESVVDELAHAVLAHTRSGQDLPKLLRDCSDLFNATFEV